MKTNDLTILEQLEQGLDVHSVKAAEIFGVNMSEVTPEMRKEAKCRNYFLIYGGHNLGPISKCVSDEVTTSE